MSSDGPIAWTLPQYEATTIENDGVSALTICQSALQLIYLDIGESI